METRFLDTFRGLAAMYVMIYHARWLLWEGFSEGYALHPESYSFIEKAQVYFFSLFKYGHEAVLMFFVLSGFVIHLRYSKLLAAGKTAFDGLDFFKRRALRIFPPFLVALVITYAIDMVIMSKGYIDHFSDTRVSVITNIINPDHSLGTLLGNLVFIMSIYVPVWGTNTALWSLSYEWYFYLFYPLLFLFSRRSPWISTIAVLLLFMMSQTFGLGILLLDKVFFYLLAWWLGAILADIYTKRISVRFKHVMPFVLLLPVLPIIEDLDQWFIKTYLDVFWSFYFFGLFAVFFWLEEKKIRVKILERLGFLGDFSYSLYVTHFPILVLMSGMLIASHGKLPKTFAFVYIGIFITLIVALLINFVAERPFIKRKAIKQSINKEVDHQIQK